MRHSLAALLVLSLASASNAFEFRTRWVERIGTTDIVIGGDGALVEYSPEPRRFRLQFGVFDGPQGTAPAGGVIGWNVGVLALEGDFGHTEARRTPGRLTPFTFATGAFSNGNPPLPGGDPFTRLTDIDNTLGTQSPFWTCSPDGVPLPRPPAVIRGLNTFVSTYEVTIDAADILFGSFRLVASGNLIAASEWRVVGTPISPDCEQGFPASILYAPVPTAPQAFTSSLNFVIPAPATASVLAVMLLVGRRHRVV